MIDLLKIKHWQIFVPYISILILYSFVSFSPLLNDIIDAKTIKLLLGLIGLIYIFGWVLLIGLQVNNLLDIELKSNKIALTSSALICFLGYAQLQLLSAGITMNLPVWVGPILTLSTFASLIYLFGTTAKLIHKSKPQSKSYLITALLLFITPIGIWIIQPKLNDISRSINK